MPEDQFTIRVDDDRSWSTNSEFGEYDATHAVIGALLAGADRVVIERDGSDEETAEDDAVPTWGAVKKLADHTVEAHKSIDERLEELERRMDRAERDLDVVDGGY